MNRRLIWGLMMRKWIPTLMKKLSLSLFGYQQKWDMFKLLWLWGLNPAQPGCGENLNTLQIVNDSLMELIICFVMTFSNCSRFRKVLTLENKIMKNSQLTCLFGKVLSNDISASPCQLGNHRWSLTYPTSIIPSHKFCGCDGTCVVTSDDTCAPLKNKNRAPTVKLLNKSENYRVYIVRQTMFTLGSGSGVWQSRFVSIVVWEVSEKLKMCWNLLTQQENPKLHRTLRLR